MEKINQERLSEIGDELVERHLDGSLDLSTFQRLFREAMDICGGPNDHLEMFSPVIRDQSWYDWLVEEMRSARAKRVA